MDYTRDESEKERVTQLNLIPVHAQPGLNSWLKGPFSIISLKEVIGLNTIARIIHLIIVSIVKNLNLFFHYKFYVFPKLKATLRVQI